MGRAGKILLYVVLAIVGTHFLFIGLTSAKPFLSPIIIGILLTMLVLPLAQKMESWKFPRSIAAMLADLVILFLSFVFFLIISSQIRIFISDWPTIRNTLEPKVERVQDYVEKKTGISIKEQIPAFILDGNAQQESGSGEDKDSTNKSSGLSKTASNALINLTSTVMEFFAFLGNALLMFVYIYFFLLYRDHFKKFILKVVKDKDSQSAEEIISRAGKIAQNYLVGKFILIIVLAILYSVGLLIIGMDYAIFAAIFAALLSLIPFLGNIIGGALAGILALVSGGGFGDILGILIVFTIAQFIENYILEPYIVGRQVDINPLIAIVAVVLGGIVWGIAGMVVAIPVTGILKVVFDHVSVMRPLGFFLGEERPGDKEGIFKKLKSKYKSVVKKD